MSRPMFLLLFLALGIFLLSIGSGLFALYVNATRYRSDPNLSGFGVARNQTSVTPFSHTVIVSAEPNELFFQYRFFCDKSGTYNFLFYFPFKINAISASTLGMNFNATPFGSAVWIKYQVSREGNYDVYGQCEIEDTFRTGTQGSYVFLLPFGRGISADVVSELQIGLGVTFFTPDGSQIDLSFVVPDALQIVQTIPPTQGAPSPVPSVYKNNMTGLNWRFTELRDSIAIYCQNSDETKLYQIFLFFSGLFIGLGGEILVTLSYDFIKTRTDTSVHTTSPEPPPPDTSSFFVSEDKSTTTTQHTEWLASLRTEYASICTYRLEWARTGHNYGWIIIPVSLTLPALIFGYTAQQGGGRIALLVAFGVCWSLLLFWRILHHQIDHQIRLLYPRAIEIEGILGLESTRTWLKEAWRLDHLPSKQEAMNKLAEPLDFSRGHLILDSYFIIYLVVTASIVYLSLFTKWLV